MPNKIQLGIYSWYGFATPLLKRLQLISAAGYDSTMLWWGESGAYGGISKRKLVNTVRDIGLQLENIHVPFDHANDIWITNKESRNRQISRYMKWIDECADFAIPIMVMHISKGYTVQQANKYGFEAMSRLADHAAKNKVIIAVENTRLNFLLDDLMLNIQNDSLKICYDTSHGMLYVEKPFGILRIYQNRIACFHISDNNGKNDDHWNIGEGIIDWNEFVHYLPDKLYNNTLSLEITRKGQDDSEVDFLKQAILRLNELIVLKYAIFSESK